jgi:hypothetical protein
VSKSVSLLGSVTKELFSEILGSHGGEVYCLLGCDSIQTDGMLPAFQGTSCLRFRDIRGSVKMEAAGSFETLITFY